MSRSSKGYTFLELLLALAIFSAGLLGLLQLQALTMRQLQESVYLNIAVGKAYYLSALLSGFAGVEGSDRAYQLEQHWRLLLAPSLPDGEGELNGTLITVSWHDPLGSHCAAKHRQCVRLQRG